jgi:hypothetical protein
MNEEQEKFNPNDKDIKVLRTYASDMAETVRDNEISVIKIALAEKEKKERESVVEKAKGTKLSRISLVVGGVALIIIGIFGASYLIKKKNTPVVPIVTKVETFISYDSSSTIDVSTATNTNNLNSLIKNGIGKDTKTIDAIFLIRKINDVITPLAVKDFLSLISTTMPDSLNRSLSNRYMIGKYSNPNGQTSTTNSGMFFIFETTDYNQAYASMLEWEKTMIEDFFIPFEIPKPDDSIYVKPWNDVVVNNKDARVLYADNGVPLIYYSFVNKNTFVITSNLETLKEIINRVLIKNVQ